AFYFVSTYARAPIPTKQRPYAFWGLPALAFALHGWQRALAIKVGYIFEGNRKVYESRRISKELKTRC
ncbi:MAG: hypothetical protein ABGX72_06720, partial [Methyloprofundus sp.]